MQCMQDACRAVKGDCISILMMRADCGASGTLIKFNPGLSSILTALHADCMQCMQAACRPVKMKLITPAFDWSFLVFLTLLPTSACFFSSLIWPLFTPWVTSGLYFLLHQNQLHPKIDKINGHLSHTKKTACYYIKITSNRDSKMMQDFLWKGGSIWAKSLFSLYPDPLTSCIDLYYRFRWGLFSKVPTHAM